MATQKQYTATLFNRYNTRTIIVAFVILTVAIIGYGFYAMTHGSIDNFQLDLNVKHQTAQPIIKAHNTQVQSLGQ